MSPPKTVLITGCSAGGLGSALVKSFHEEGFMVFATARDPTKAQRLQEYKGIEVMALDVTSADSIASCVGQVAAKTGGRLDYLINNAGGALFGPLVHASVDQGKRLYDVNVWGLLSVSQAFTPLLIESGGVIVNISSIAGAVPLAWQGLYNSSKAAVTFISETLKLELQPLGVRVVTAMVGAIGTNLYENKAPFALPPDSYYKPIEGIIASQAAGALQDPNNEDVSVTAGNIIRDVVGGRSGQIWRGGEAGRASILSWLIPTKIRERILHQERGLYQLKKLR